VIVGGTCYSREISKKIQSLNSNGTSTNKSLSNLTPRQVEVLRHLAAGESVKEVARSLNLSGKSVDSHKYRIMRWLGIHDRVKLSLFAVREELIFS
jgi:DNA-binding NarL/FixJ family response regulator